MVINEPLAAVQVGTTFYFNYFHFVLGTFCYSGKK